MPTAAVRVDMALGGSWRQQIVTAVPALWYRFCEQSGATVLADYSGNARHGAFVNGVVLQQDPFVAEGGFCAQFDGSNDYCTTGTVPAFGTTFAIEAWIKPNTPGAEGVIVGDATGTSWFSLRADRKLNFRFSATDHLSSTAVPNLTPTHVLLSVVAGAVTFYINGVASGTATYAATFTASRVGAHTSGTLPFKGWIDEVVIYTATGLTVALALAHYAAGAWTDVTGDTIQNDGLDHAFGISGNGPKDRLADPGVATVTMNNGSNNSGGVRGYYSPGNANCRPGFTKGALMRVVYTSLTVEYVRWTGRLSSIDPSPGQFLAQVTRVQAFDLMDDLVETSLRNVTLQIGRTEAQLIQTVVDSLPETAKPLATVLDTGLDTCPYAFDALGDGEKAIGPLADLAISSIGFVHMRGDGVLRYENRQARPLKMSSFAFDNSMIDLVVPANLDGVFNHVRATGHPKNIDPAATTVIWSMPVASGTQPSSTPIGPGATVELWGTYFAPSNPNQNIGGTAQVAPVSGTDYVGNALADGTGANKTANLSIVASFFASTFKYAITNSDVATVYVTSLQVRGKGLYDNAPATVESISTQSYGDRPVDIDMPFQSSITVTKGLADYIRSQYESVTQATSVTFDPQDNAAAMLFAMTVQVGDRFTVTEAQTGLTLVDVFVQRIQFQVGLGGYMRVTLMVAATSFFDQVWVMDDAALALMDASTYMGFA